MPAYPTFPELSRKPALKTKTTSLDPTLRDPMENGMVASRAAFTRRRRKWSVTIDALTPNDVAALEAFVMEDAVFGAQMFFFADTRDPRNPQQYLVRFDVIPSYTDAGSIEGEFRQGCSFEIGEV